LERRGGKTVGSRGERVQTAEQLLYRPPWKKLGTKEREGKEGGKKEKGKRMPFVVFWRRGNRGYPGAKGKRLCIKGG